MTNYMVLNILLLSRLSYSWVEKMSLSLYKIFNLITKLFKNILKRDLLHDDGENPGISKSKNLCQIFPKSQLNVNFPNYIVTLLYTLQSSVI